MGLGDKIDNAAEKLGGKGKEAAGEATGDDSLKAEGKTRPGEGGPEAGRRKGQGRFQERLKARRRREGCCSCSGPHPSRRSLLRPRRMGRVMQSPLPVRDGVNATRLRLPEDGPWDTALGLFMMHRWGHIDPQGIEDRFDAGEIVGEAGVALDRSTPLQEHTFIWYYRTLPPETRMPVELNILHQDDHLLVVDKPHFLPTTPGGTYIQESALVRLRNQLDLPDLIPMHRLDRMTGGVLLLSTNPAHPRQVPGVVCKNARSRRSTSVWRRPSRLPGIRPSSSPWWCGSG